MAAMRPLDPDPDPLKQFRAWFDEAAAAGVAEPEAVALATVSPEGVPSVRMVLYRGLDGGRFTFYTNYRSRKARELEANPHAALAFHWRQAEARFPADDVPRPPFWGGYGLLPAAIEFWTGFDDRLHDRVRYERSGGGWRWTRLQP